MGALLGQAAAACLLGMALGGVWELLLPLRRRSCCLGDGIFALCALTGWIFLAFRICRGDIRLVHLPAMAAGGAAFRMTLGRLMRPGILALSRWAEAILGKLFRPVGQIAKKFRNFAKKPLQLGKNRLQ